jgi:hypothetical protein
MVAVTLLVFDAPLLLFDIHHTVPHGLQQLSSYRTTNISALNIDTFWYFLDV